jgi:aspartyl-tRNA(Asn)/glutamyl-tRNA(Gln) amidotransferase subunit A
MTSASVEHALDLGATQLVSLLRDGAVTPMELAQALVARVAATDGLLHAFVHFEAEHVLRAAEHADSTTLLAGLPIAVKDNLDVADVPTTAGSRVLGDAGRVATHDAGAVARVRASGGVIAGKTALHEFAYGATGVNPSHGTPANPWDLSRMPGGSSSGSAVAVAARQAPLALGTDAAGSIRMPAALCGVVGLKPTFGRVSTRGVVASHNTTVDHVGPIARSVADVALGMAALAGFDPDDITSIDEPVADYVGALARQDSLHGVRIGVPRTYFFERVASDVEHGVRTAIEHLASLGADLFDLDIPDLDDLMPLRLALFADGVAFHLPHLREHPELYTREIRQRLLVDTFMHAHDVARAQRVRTILQQRFARAFIDDDVQAIATPTTPVVAAPTDAWMVEWPGAQPEPIGLALLRLTAPANLTGLPAISVPCGFTASPELPIGLQLIGRPFEEAALLHIAHVYECTTPWHMRRPPEAPSV